MNITRARRRSETPQVYTPPVEESATQLRAQVAAFSGLELGKPDKVYVSLHAESQPGAHSTSFYVTRRATKRALWGTSLSLHAKAQVRFSHLSITDNLKGAYVNMTGQLFHW